MWWKGKALERCDFIATKLRLNNNRLPPLFCLSVCLTPIPFSLSLSPPLPLFLCLSLSQYKLGKVKRVQLGPKGVPFLVTHDGRTIRYPDPLVRVNDTVRIDIATGKITDFVKFDVGNLVMVVGGRNLGRVGVITHREKHHGSFDIIHIKDSTGNTFATRQTNVFVIGKSTKALISLPKTKGIRLTIAEERDRRLQAKGIL